MVRLILEETAPPAVLETIKALQVGHTEPIDALLNMFPAPRILFGMTQTIGTVIGTVNLTEGLILWKGKTLPIPSFSGAEPTQVSVIKTVVNRNFNIGTKSAPNYQDRPAEEIYSAVYGEHPENIEVFEIAQLWKTRMPLEYIHRDNVFVGDLVVANANDPMYYTFPIPQQQTSNYIVVGNFTPLDNEQEFLDNFTWSVVKQKKASFDVLITDATGENQGLMFNYILIPMIDNLPTLTVAG